MKFVIKLIILVILFGNSFFSSANESEIVIVNATGSATISLNQTISKAKADALNNARINAITHATGVQISNFSTIRNGLMQFDLIDSFTQGLIVEERILSWNGSWSQAPTLDQLGLPIIEVNISASVKAFPSNYFRHELLLAKLNKSVYQIDDHIKIALSILADGYLLVSNYTNNNLLVPLYPNSSSDVNYFVSGTKTEIPGSKQQQFIVAANDLAESHSENLILTLISPSEPFKTLDWTQIFSPGQEVSPREFYQQIMQLRPTWISQVVLPFKIISK
ncbi:MAG: DUF4384 domain-containing protein [Gammaproteobacteria bacterium]|nr:DUF4384 domain-containing protein [Gammaproteobacteria bacterium]